MSGTTRALRSDAERTVRTILEAAERVLSKNPAAGMEQIAEAGGVARTTVHRRFASRDALVEAMAAWATRQFAAAVEAAQPEQAPPLVALYQATANVLRVKIDWGFAMSRASVAGAAGAEVARVHAEVEARCDRLFRQARAPASPPPHPRPRPRPQPQPRPLPRARLLSWALLRGRAFSSSPASQPSRRSGVAGQGVAAFF
ncbi:TetR/AcrR family transcriptional regulator [Nonomuraea sp. NPDC052265]|uniref:TetR/AcrR family transcriptional regulator n=1 Tax=Nonomuraea sp. NPDC052265 TaxID=3364374 RepID=UPI0037C7BCB3